MVWASEFAHYLLNVKVKYFFQDFFIYAAFCYQSFNTLLAVQACKCHYSISVIDMSDPSILIRAEMAWAYHSCHGAIDTLCIGSAVCQNLQLNKLAETGLLCLFTWLMYENTDIDVDLSRYSFYLHYIAIYSQMGKLVIHKHQMNNKNVYFVLFKLLKLWLI